MVDESPVVARLEGVQEERRAGRSRRSRSHVPTSRSCVAYASWTSGRTARPKESATLGDPVEELVDLGLDHEAGRAGLLDHVADRIEPDDPDARAPRTVATSRVIRSRVAADVTSRSICSDQSARPERRPDRSSRPVSSIVTVENGASGLRRKISATSASAGVALRPDLVERDEQVGRRRFATLTLEVLELRALARDVVDHQVEQDVVAIGDPGMSPQRPEPRVDLAVRQRREAAVARRRESAAGHGRPWNSAVERAFEQVAERAQVATQRIRVRQSWGRGADQRDGTCDRPTSAAVVPRRAPPVARRSDAARHPFTDPCRSAAITCRWNTMNTSRVGSRIRIVPAQSSGMSVA